MIDVILPVLDERDALPWVLERIPDGYRAIVADNASTDGSGALAARLGALVVDAPVRGFGSACHAGLLAATADVVCFMDADASLDPRELPQLVALLDPHTPTLALGARRPTTRGAWPLHARLANRGLARELRRRTGAQLTDLGPMRAAPREALLGLGMTDRRFGYPLETVLRAGGAGWQIVEAEIPYHPRTGRSKVTGTARGTARTIRDMSRVLA